MGAGDLHGQLAVVTGAARGIGAAVARALGHEGAAILLVDKETGALEATAESLRGEGIDASAVVCDVSDEDDVATLKRTVERAGTPKVLVNQAGIIYRAKLEAMSVAEWDRVMSVNVRSVFLMCRALVPTMLESGGGAIVNIASGAAFAAGRELAAYTCSKGAVLALTRALAVDYAPTIRVNAVCPGLIDTPGAYEFPGSAANIRESRGRAAEAVPLGRYGTSEEVARAVVFLAGPGSSFCTGSAFVIDGGKLAAG